MIRIESSWSGLPHAPNIIAPRQRGLTCIPVRPRLLYSMGRHGMPVVGSPHAGMPAPVAGLAATMSEGPATASGTFQLGGTLPVTRLGFGSMQLTGEGVWG